MKNAKQLLALVLTLAMLTSAALAAPATLPEDHNADASVESSGAIIIDVLDYGADPSGKNDSTVAVQKALEAARAEQSAMGADSRVTLNFPKGEYRFSKDYATARNYHTSNTSSLSNPTKYIGFLIEDMKNLTVEGNDSLFLMYGDIMAIAVVRSQGVTLQNFVLDYADPDTIDVTVVGQGTAGGSPYVDLYIPATSRYEIINTPTEKTIQWQGAISEKTGKPYWTDKGNFGAYLVIYKGYDETVRRHNTTTTYEGATVKDADPFVGVSNVEQLEDNIVRITYKNRRPKDQENGNVYLLSNSARRRTAGAFIWESSQTLVRDIDVHYLSGFGWLTQMSKDTEFNGVDFLPREGAGKYTTSNADQIHVAGAGGYFNVKNCNFSMAHDDPINVHGTYMRVEEVIDSKTLRMQYIHSQQGGYQGFFPGDQVMFYSRTHLESVAHVDENDTFTVASVVDVGEEYDGSKLDMRTNIVTFNEEFSPEVLAALEVRIKRKATDTTDEPLYVAENVTYAPTVEISGNRMRSIPTRGILCTTRNPVVIKNNIFENLAMAGCFLSNDADYWYESGPIRNMEISNNKFYVRTTGQNEWGDAGPFLIDPVVVGTYVVSSGTEPTPKGDPVHQNIRIKDNEIHLGDYNIITAKGVKGLEFTGNTVVRDGSGIKVALDEIGGSLQVGDKHTLETNVTEKILPAPLFTFNDCTNLKIENNTYSNGLNQKIRLNRPLAETDSITDAGLQINGTDDNITTEKSNLKFVSSDPAVAQVDGKGVVTALSAGTTELLAYYVDGEAIVESNRLTVTVEGSGTTLESLAINEADNQAITEESDTLTFTTDQGSGETWSVLDAKTGLPTAAASISNSGVLTGHGDGVVKVIAEKLGASDSKTVVISLPQSYGVKQDVAMESEATLNTDEGFRFQGKEDKANWSGTALNAIVLGSKTPGQISGNDQGATENLLTFAIPETVNETAFRMQVTIDNLPTAAYAGAALLLFNDTDNYVSAGSKTHLGVLGVNEKGGGATESALSPQVKPTKVTVEIERTADGIVVRYKDSASSWKDIATYANGALGIVDDGLKVGFYVNQPGSAPVSTESTFSDFKIASTADAATSGALEEMASINFLTSFPTLSDPKDILAEGVGIIREDNASWDGTGKENEIAVVAKHVGDKVPAMKNIFTYDVSGELKTDMRVQVTLDGVLGGNYSGMHLMLYDGSKYVRVGTRSHLGGIRYDDPVELQAFPDKPTGSKVTYEIEKTGTTINVRYQNAGGAWSPAYTGPTPDTLSDTYKIALVSYAHATSASEFPVTYSDLKIAKASEVSTEELEAQDAVPLMLAADNTAPTVTNLATDKESYNVGDTITTTGYSYADADGHTEGAPLYCWTTGTGANKTVTYTTKNTFATTKAGDVTCAVYVFDQYGKPCAEPITKTVSVTLSGENYDLSALYVNGSPVDGMTLGTYEYTFKLPDHVTQFTLGYDTVSGEGVTELQKADGTPITSKLITLASLGDTPVVKLLRKDGNTVKATYTLTLKSILGNDTTSIVTVDGTPLGASHLIKAGTNSYFTKLTNGQNIVPITVIAPEGAKVQVWRSFYLDPIANEGNTQNEFTAQVDLYSGLNIFNIDVTAADGVTVTRYRAQVFRTGSSGADALTLKVNGVLVDGFNPDTLEYLVDIMPEQAGATRVEATTDEMDATVTITRLGGYPRSESGAATFALDRPMSQVVVAVRAENLATTKYYTLNLHVVTSKNADLYTLGLTDDAAAPIVLSPKFEAGVQRYTTEYTGKTLRVAAKAQEAGAKLTLYAENGQTYTSEGGVLDKSVNVYPGINVLKCVVLAPDGKTKKTYSVIVNVTDSVYLSDLPTAQWLTNTSGYAPLPNQRDLSVDGNPLRVLVDGVSTQFAKGVGTHATSTVEIDLTGKGYTHFSVLTGIDQEMSGSPSSVRFYVYVDGTVKWDSGKSLLAGDDAMKVSIDIPEGAKKLKLYADEGSNNASDHADWADAKLSDPSLVNEALPEATITGVASPEDMSVPYGTTAQQLALPELAEVTLSDGRASFQLVTWNLSEYDGNKPGSYTLTGSFTDLPSNILNPDDLKVTLVLSVQAPPSSGGGTVVTPKAQPPKTEGDTTTVVTELKPTVSGTTATVTVASKTITDSITSAVAEAEKNGTTAEVELKVTAAETAKTVSVNLGKQSVADLANKSVRLTVTSPVASFTFDHVALIAIAATAVGTVKITAKRVENSTLSTALKAAVGDRPAYELTVSDSGKTISDFGDGRATVRLPYALKSGESAAGVCIYYMDDQGLRTKVASAYNAETSTVTFKTGHFSFYVVGYDELATWTSPFTDVNTGAWYFTDVAYVAQKGLLKGTTDTAFQPDLAMTRAMFLTVLHRMSGKATDASGDTWYSAALAWAKAEGLSDGENPERAITRQEMSTMLYRYAKWAGFAPTGDWAVKLEYADVAEISNWATEGAMFMQMKGIIGGKPGNLFDPNGTATRAEVSAVLHRFAELFMAADEK